MERETDRSNATSCDNPQAAACTDYSNCVSVRIGKLFFLMWLFDRCSNLCSGLELLFTPDINHCAVCSSVIKDKHQIRTWYW